MITEENELFSILATARYKGIKPSGLSELTKGVQHILNIEGFESEIEEIFRSIILDGPSSHLSLFYYMAKMEQVLLYSTEKAPYSKT